MLSAITSRGKGFRTLTMLRRYFFSGGKRCLSLVTGRDRSGRLGHTFTAIVNWRIPRPNPLCQNRFSDSCFSVFLLLSHNRYECDV
jgi:hypothetical protein